jgi:hypothetical protein
MFRFHVYFTKHETENILFIVALICEMYLAVRQQFSILYQIHIEANNLTKTARRNRSLAFQILRELPKYFG